MLDKDLYQRIETRIAMLNINAYLFVIVYALCMINVNGVTIIGCRI